MSFVTNVVIGFYPTDIKELKKNIKTFLELKEEEFRYRDFYKKGAIKEVSSGTKGPTYYVIAGGFNYFDPELFIEMCEWLRKEKKIHSEGVVRREDWENRLEIINNTVWQDD
jgi:hypothetical protein